MTSQISTDAMRRRPTSEGALELARLSRQLSDNDHLRAIVESCGSWQIPAVLNATADGRALLADLDAYDERYGRRAAADALPAASWTDDPTALIESLRDLLREPDVHSSVPYSLAA